MLYKVLQEFYNYHAVPGNLRRLWSVAALLVAGIGAVCGQTHVRICAEATG